MRFTAVLLFAPLLAAALPEVGHGESREALEAREDFDPRERLDTRDPDEVPELLDARDMIGGTPADFGVEKRACKYNGCKCAKGYKGVYCANCKTKSGNPYYVVSLLGTGGGVDHVYQCNGATSCCDYGYATKCKNGKAGRCGT